MIPLLSVLIVVLSGLLIAVLIQLRNCMKRCSALREKLEDYLAGREECCEWSTRDDAISLLENSAAELVNANILEKEKNRKVLRRESDFLADVSHQFKTPLAGIRLFTEMDRAPHEKQVIELVERMEGWIYALLRLEKIRANALETEFSERNLRTLVQEIVSQTEALYPDVELSVEGDAVFRCDEKYLWEALSNLITNACQHAQSRVRVELESHEGTVFVRIVDDGGGIPEEKIPLMFHRFSTAVSGNPNSTGLGLAIAREIVEKHHGTVHAENYGSGLLVTICFPVLEGRLPIS